MPEAHGYGFSFTGAKAFMVSTSSFTDRQAHTVCIPAYPYARCEYRHT